MVSCTFDTLGLIKYIIKTNFARFFWYFFNVQFKLNGKFKITYLASSLISIGQSWFKVCGKWTESEHTKHFLTTGDNKQYHNVECGLMPHKSGVNAKS